MTSKVLYRLETTVFIALILTCSFKTYQRNFVWQDYLTLWSDVVTKSPEKARAHNYLGLGYQGKKRHDEAIVAFQKAIILAPLDANAYSNLGITYFEKGMVDNAILNFKHAIKINPGHADAHYNLGIAYGEKGMMEQAYSEMRMGTELRKKR